MLKISCVAAILKNSDDKVLLQLRDDRPSLSFASHWTLPVYIADALVWGNAPFSIIDYSQHIADFNQFFARAELLRVIELETLHTIEVLLYS